MGYAFEFFQLYSLFIAPSMICLMQQAENESRMKKPKNMLDLFVLICQYTV